MAEDTMELMKVHIAWGSGTITTDCSCCLIYGHNSMVNMRTYENGVAVQESALSVNKINPRQYVARIPQVRSSREPGSAALVRY